VIENKGRRLIKVVLDVDGVSDRCMLAALAANQLPGSVFGYLFVNRYTNVGHANLSLVLFGPNLRRKSESS